MKTGLIVINGYANYPSTNHQVKRLLEEFSCLDTHIDVKKSTEITAYIKNDLITLDLPKYDFVIFLDKDRYLSSMLEKCGYRLFNSAHSIEVCDDKMTTHLELANTGVRMPKTIPAPLCYVDNKDYSNLDKIIEQLGLPIVVKECYGSKGAQVYLAKTKEELILIEEKVRNRAHLFQEFVSPGGIDYRLIVINHKVIASMRRENKEDFRSNIAQGGIGECVSLSEEYIKAAEKVSKVLELDYCGVDLLTGKEGEPLVCEVNSNAFFEGIEKATEINVAKTYAEYILNEIKKPR